MSRLLEVLPQITAVVIKNLLLVEDGLVISFPTVLVPGLSRDDPHERIHFDMHAISRIFIISMIFLLIGNLITGPVTHAFGKRTVMQFVTIPLFISWMMLYFSTENWHVFLSLCMSGLCRGFLNPTVLTYVAEITRPSLRGTLTCMSFMIMVIGPVIQYLLGARFPWRTVALINCIWPIICLLFLFVIPESPIWFLIKNKPNKAEESLIWLRRWTSPETVEKEFQDLSKMVAEGKMKVTNASNNCCQFIKWLMRRELYRPLALVTLIFFIGCLNGSSTLIVYAAHIFTTFNTKLNGFHLTLTLAGVHFLGAFCAVIFINLLGKRRLTFLSLFGSAVCYAVISAHLYYKNISFSFFTTTDDSTEHWIPAVFLILSAFMSFLGITILPWILMGEVFPNEYRATAAGLSYAIGCVLHFFGNKTFLGIVNFLQLSGVFLSYSLLSLLGILVVYFVLPETEGRSLHEIGSHFRGETRLGNDVKRKNQKQDAEKIDETITSCDETKL